MYKIPRLHFIDAFRGVLVLIMVFYHLLFDLNSFGYLNLNIQNGFIEFLANIVRFSFIFLAGLSTAIIKINTTEDRFFIKKMIYRISVLIFCSFLITLTTYYFTEAYIFWGVLHLISLLLVILLLLNVKLRFNFQLIYLLLVFSLLYSFDKGKEILGLSEVSSSTLDFFPVLPWVIPGLLGFYSFKYLIPLLVNINSFKYPKSVILFGKNSLIIYMIHQPVFISILYLLK